MTETAWTFPVVVDDLPDEGETFDVVPDETARAELAKSADVVAVPSLVARMEVRPDGRGGAEVEGTLDATVRQNCVVTLEPFDNKIEEKIFVRFAPPGSLVPADESPAELGEDDPPDELVNGAVDLAAVVTEFLALAVDPYPRKPGAVFSPPESAKAEKEPSPFAALEKLKRGNGSENP
jgi:uncharacterized metal-binding protein YceD (DUF177 family)